MNPTIPSISSSPTRAKCRSLRASRWIAQRALAVLALFAVGWGTDAGLAAAADMSVLPIQGDMNGLSDSEVQSVRDAVDAELQARPRITALPRPTEDLIDLMFDAECLEPDPACLAAIGKARGADHVLFYEAQAKGGSVGIGVRLVKVKKAKLDGPKSVRGATLAQTLTALSEGLDEWLGTKPAPKPTMVTLRVRSNPSAAVVVLDGEEIGVTPTEIRRPAGTFALRVSKAGYEDVERSVELRDKDVDFALELTARPEPAAAAAVVPPTTTDGPDDGPAYYETWWFWTVVAVGAAGAGVGIAAAAGAFDADSTPTGGMTFQLGSRPDQDILIQEQFR